MKRANTFVWSLVAVLSLSSVQVLGQTPLGTPFTYQGQLKHGGFPVDDTADFEFSLWSDPNSTDPNNQVGSTVSASNVSVDKGLFTVQLDFGASAFDGNARWLGIAVRSPGGAGPFVTLSPRQPVTATPHALQTRGIYVSDDLKIGVGTVQPEAALHIVGGDDTVPVLNVTGAEGAAIGITSGYGAEGAQYGSPGAGIQITAGTGGSVTEVGGYGGDGGFLHLKAGDGASTWADVGVAGSGGDLYLAAGDGGGAGGMSGAGGSGGDVTIAAGHDGGGIYGGIGGNASITAGGGEYGGNVTISAGSGFTGSNPIAGGHVIISGGAGPLPGLVKLGLSGRGVTIGRCDLSSEDFFFDVGTATRIGSDLPTGGLAVTQTGDVGIGTTSPSERLHVEGNICATGTIGACSDGRLKQNVTPIGGALTKIGRLRGVQFDWRQDGHPGRNFKEQRQVGFIAQEVNVVLPEVVSQGADGFFSVDYGRVVPVLVEAVKQLRKQSEAEVAELSKANADNDTRIAEQRELIALLDGRLSRTEALLADIVRQLKEAK